MTEDILPPEVFKKLTPEYVALVVAYLCGQEVPDSALGVHRRRGRFSARRCSRTRV